MRYIYSVLDIQAQVYSDPMFLVSKGVALRMFADEVNNPNSSISKHPSDYKLVELGVWDEIQASFELHPTPLVLGEATEYKQAA